MTTHPTTSAVDALRELYALVKGECPSLLNEDSGGDAELDLRIETILEQGDGHASDCAVHNAPALEPGPCDCAPIHAPGAWTEEQIERAARTDFDETLRLMGCDPLADQEWVSIKEIRIAAMRAALASLNATPGAQGHGAGAGWRGNETADQINDRLKRQREGGLSTLADWLHREASRSMDSSYSGSWCPNTVQLEAWRQSVTEAQAVIRRALTTPDADHDQPEAMPGREEMIAKAKSDWDHARGFNSGEGLWAREYAPQLLALLSSAKEV